MSPIFQYLYYTKHIKEFHHLSKLLGNLLKYSLSNQTKFKVK